MLQRRSTMDLLGGIRITKRCTNRNTRPQSIDQSVCRPLTRVEDTVNPLLPLSDTDKQHLHIIINPMDKCPPPPHRLQVDGSCDIEHGGMVRVASAMRRHEQFLEGLLLRNMDPSRRFPYFLYTVFNTAKQGHFVNDSHLEREMEQALGPELLTHIGNYEEMYTFIDPSLPFLPKKPTNPNVGYIVTVFRSIGNQATLDQSWATWSGANFIAAHAPPELRLQRLSLHRMYLCEAGPEMPVSYDSRFSYVLVCELGEALSNVCIAREFVDKLWTRECGYTSLYVLDTSF